MRKADAFLLWLAGAGLGLALISIYTHAFNIADEGRMARMGGMVRRYGLTDLCLFTEARYTRHPSMADLHTPFQDHPMSLEHFPSGSLIEPPGARPPAIWGALPPH